MEESGQLLFLGLMKHFLKELQQCLQPGRLILPAGIDRVKRNLLALGLREKIHQQAGGQVTLNIQPRFVGNADALQGPLAHQCAIIGGPVTADQHLARLA